MTPLKMSMICTIQMLEEKIDPFKRHEFETFEKMEYSDLKKYRDELIPIYNESIRRKKK